MKHKFLAKVTDKSICVFCSYPMEAHLDNAVCESCANIGPCDVVNHILMCSSCQARELEPLARATVPVQVETKLPIEQVVNQVNRLVDTDQIQNARGESVKTIMDNAVKGNIAQFTDFFNASIPSIIELSEAIESDESVTDKKYELARVLRARVQYLSMVLFQFNNKAVEMSGEVKSIQKYMNDLIPSLRKDLREEFALNNTDYKPIPIKEIKTPKVKLSATDRLAESTAKLMNITIEQARKIVLGQLKKTEIECTCAVTPGICKLHNS